MCQTTKQILGYDHRIRFPSFGWVPDSMLSHRRAAHQDLNMEKVGPRDLWARSSSQPSVFSFETVADQL